MTELVATPEPRPDTASAAVVDWPEEPAGEIYHWPVWRFGTVLALPDGVQVTVSQAQELGEHFQKDGWAARRYNRERPGAIQEAAVEAGARLVTSAAAGVPAWLAASESQIRVTYHVVPVVRFPRRFIELEGALWLLREGLTVCGHPSRSKVWLAASLIAVEGASTLVRPIQRDEVYDHRQRLEPMRQKWMAGLRCFYQGLVREHVLEPEAPAVAQQDLFSTFAEVEILGLSVDADLNTLLDRVERRGVGAISQGGEDERPLRDFLDLAEQPGGLPSTGQWVRGRPKMLDVYDEEALYREPLRALVVPYLPTENVLKVWYGCVSALCKGPGLKAISSEMTTRALTQEYGRCY